MHPPHVPLEAEAEAPGIGRMRDAGPGGRFLRHRHRAGGVGIGRLVGLAQEVDRFQVLVAAILVRDPLARPARIVEIQHRRHRIDPQPVEVVMLEPEPGVRGEEGRDLGAPEIVDVGAPVLVEALARVGMLVEMGAVELAEAVGIEGEVARHPVEQDADAGLVRRVDELRKILGRAEAAGRRVERDRLVAPGPVERMLGDRQELDMGEAHLLGIGNQAIGQLAIGEVAVALAGHRAQDPRWTS